MKKTGILLSVILLIIAIFSTANNLLYIDAYSAFDDMTAKSYIVVDQSGNVLIEKNSDQKREVASICKLMTTLITLENIEHGAISESTQFIASHNACDAEGSQAFLDPNSKYLVRDLLKSVIVASANDSAIVLAEGIAGSEDNFVDLMNKRAKELGMTNTLYNNSTGLPATEQYSTARDTAILLNEVSKHSLYVEDCHIWMDTLVHPSGRETELVNTNRLIKYYEYCNTGKTGFTDEAGYCLSSTAMQDDLKLTCVVLGCSSSANRFKESVELYNYCYANFKNDQILSNKIEIDNNIEIMNGKVEKITLRPLYDYYYTQSRVGAKDVNIELDLPEKLKAPIIENDIVGNVLVIVEGEVVAEVPVVACETIEKQNYKDIVSKIIDRFDIFD